MKNVQIYLFGLSDDVFHLHPLQCCLNVVHVIDIVFETLPNDAKDNIYMYAPTTTILMQVRGSSSLTAAFVKYSVTVRECYFNCILSPMFTILSTLFLLNSIIFTAIYSQKLNQDYYIYVFVCVFMNIYCIYMNAYAYVCLHLYCQNYFYVSWSLSVLL